MSGSLKSRLFMCRLLIASAFFLGAPPQSHADALSEDALQACSAIDDAPARLACYDEAVGRSAPAAKTPATLPAERPVKKTLDDLGDETLPGTGRADDEALAVRATVVGCEKDARKKYVFFFENGQVWRQSSDKRVYFKNCNFDVTISKDFFGYKMQRDGDKGRIRIARVK
ncbi:MAG: hypothetical protein OEM50_01145 [Gammaproteobacteria bacterium]|nr:hypothetical protein [Gammaproteobacteria bacterium]MDH3362261.1 hypothetical protein [Gammaproteobacteria bacterium]MDH3480291.1 hypothetical protein [Gammaproteobacteria bacterium]